MKTLSKSHLALDPRTGMGQPDYIHNQFILDSPDQELAIDNFAGGGGASTGIEEALGRHIDLAINHDADAIAMHKANHPRTVHLTEDVFAVDPVKATGGRRVGLAWFSPDCTDFSKAKGGKPRRKKIRGLAWVMVKWATEFKDAGLPMPRVMYLENVEEFQTWGPLLGDGTRCPKRIGKTFRQFVNKLRRLGYAVEWREIRACDFGAPTTRKRLFLIARCDSQPIIWPAPTHFIPKDLRKRGGFLVDSKGKIAFPQRIAAECIDWGIPCPSIFMTKAQAKRYNKLHGTKIKRPLAKATMRRIGRGIRKFVFETSEPFIVEYHSAKREGDDRVKPIGEPLPTQTVENRFGLVVPHITKFRTGATGHAANEPLHTITAGPKENPAGAAHALGLVAATLVQTGYGERKGQKPRALDLNKPLGTVVATGNKHAAVTAFLAKHYGGHETPGSDLRKGFDTVTARDHHAVVTAQIVGCGGRAAQSRPRSVAEPMHTITGKADACVAVSHLSKFYGTTTGQPMTAPVDTITGQGRKFAQVCAFLTKYYGNEKDGCSVADPLSTITTKDRLALITIHGEDYAITDIGMRMLRPRELFNAQGFPPDYKITPMVMRKRGKKIVEVPLPQDGQVRMVGNSVSPPPATALVIANNPELRVTNQRRKRAA